MNSDDIIRAIKEGAKWAAPAMVTVVGPVLLGYAETVASDLTPSEREIAVEKAIVRGVANLERFDERRGTFAGWLRPFVRHAVGDIRRERGSKVVPFPDDLAEPSAPDENPIAVAEADAMRAALASLSDTDRLIITLRDYEHIDYDGCAERIGGVSAAACRVRHHRALRRLAEAARSQAALAHYFAEEAQ